MAELHVPADYPTIAAAVEVARARTDDSTTILLAPGRQPMVGTSVANPLRRFQKNRMNF